MVRSRELRFVLTTVTVCLLLIGVVSWIASAETTPRIPLEKAAELHGEQGVIFIDVRSESDWTGSDAKVAGAVREDPARVSQWMGKYPKNAVLIFYCA